ncbi:MAG: FAD-dependent oxidoreductase [Coriobacteriia bacterium]|nr:FAD-dependent oxidoreductase [Coriobacteriia bacterium]
MENALSTVTLQVPDIPIKFETDVIVVGGGSGGIGAAIAAARNGAQVILVEQSNHLGGLAAHGLVSVYMNSDRNVRGGIYAELVGRLIERGCVLENSTMAIPYDKEEYKWLLQNMVLDAGVKLLLRTSYTDSLIEDGVITGIICDSIAGRFAIKGKVVIDCTRLATVGVRSGASILVPIELQPVVFCHVLRGINYPELNALLAADDEYFSDPTKHLVSPKGYGGVKYWPWTFMGGQKYLQEAKERGDFTFDKNEVFFFGYLDSGQRMRFLDWLSVSTSLDAFDIKAGNYDIESISQIEVNMREHVWAAAEYLKKNVKGFAASEVDATPDETGLWGTRLEGDWVMSMEDMFEGAEYEDSVVIASWILDNADFRRFDCPLHEIPYRAFYSKDIDNLMAGGFNISADAISCASIVDQPTCISTGEVSGTAAALAVRDGVKVRDVDVKKLQETLQAQGLMTAIKMLPAEVAQEYADSMLSIREEMEKTPYSEVRTY